MEELYKDCQQSGTKGLSLLLAGTCPANPSNVEHLVNSSAECGLDLRQEIGPSLSLLHVLVGSVQSKVCGAEQSPFSQLAGKPPACFTYSSRGSCEKEGSSPWSDPVRRTGSNEMS